MRANFMDYLETEATFLEKIEVPTHTTYRFEEFSEDGGVGIIFFYPAIDRLNERFFFHDHSSFLTPKERYPNWFSSIVNEASGRIEKATRIKQLFETRP